MKPSFEPLAAANRLWGIHLDEPAQLKANYRRFVVDLLRLFVANRTPITLWGPPGARKTRSIEALCRETDENGTPYQVITIQPSTQDPTIIHGMMYTAVDASTGETVMRRSIPDIAQEVVGYREQHDGLTILFMDEMTTCMPAQQHALLGILTHGKYGDVDISDDIAIIMAANPEGTVSTVNPLGEQVINRGGHLAWYGDLELFLSEWSSGFNRPEQVPDPDTEWYTRTLLHQAPEKAFRNPGRWSPEELVPYELMEHTERAVTEHARMVTLLNQVLGASKDEVRYYYLVEMTRALLGPEWAERMAAVTAMERRRITAASIISAVRDKAVESTWTTDQLCAALGDSLHRSPTGTLLSHDQETTLAEDLLRRVGTVDIDPIALRALWAFAMTAPNAGTRMGLHRYLLQATMTALPLVKAGTLSREDARPNFVDAETLAALRGRSSA